MSNGSRPENRRFIALIPAAGIASRLPQLEFSKEMLPVQLRPDDKPAADETEPAICHLLRAFRLVRVAETRIVSRSGKKDITEHLGDVSWADMNIRFHLTEGTSGVPETVSRGLHDHPNADVLFGFPDILFEPADAFSMLGKRLRKSEADVVLGLFPTETPSKMDMVRTDPDGRVTAIEIKPGQTSLKYTWIMAAWKPTFTDYLLATQHCDQHLGHTLLLAIRDGLRVESVTFASGRSLDIGTPDDLDKARHWFDRDD